MRRSLLLASVALFAVMAAPGETQLVATAHAESSGREWVDAREKWQGEVARLTIRIRDYQLSPRYCRRPHRKDKTFDEVSLDQLAEELSLLKTEFERIKTGTNAATRSGTAGSLTTDRLMTGDYPKYKGREVTDDMHWKLMRSDYVGPAEKLLQEKRDTLARAPEDFCGEPTPKKEAEIVGPPVQPPPPPPPPPEPPPPVDPLKGLNRPISKGVNFPRLEKFYCSQAQKDAALALIPPEIAKVNANIADIDAYIASLKTRRGELKARGVEQHWLDSMDYEVRNAETEKASQTTTIQTLETTRSLIASTPIVDCAKEGKEIGSLPGTTLGAGVAYGDLAIPKKPYLSLEVGSDLFLGVVDYETEDELLVINGRVEYEFRLDSVPNVKLLGDPRDQRWMTSAELFGYDYSIFSEGRDIDTTTEGVGIPGTGDPLSSFPEGVFFANPDFNDVTNIRYAHDADFRGGALTFGQKSFHDSHACYVGVGVGYNRLRTIDVLTGTVDGFLTDFRYETDVATRNTNLFIRGGVEIPLDNFWDQQLRYAGEFSGFRLSLNGEGRANFLDAEGLDRLDLSGFVNDSQAVRVGKDDTTFSYKLSAGLNYAPAGIKGLDVSLGVEYGESDTHPVAHRSGQTGETTRIEFEQEEVFVGTLGTRFRF
jgi:opacity protein-like surface antigen